MFSFQMCDNEQRRLTVNMWPGLERFLRSLCADTSLEVDIVTAGEEHYAAPLLDRGVAAYQPYAPPLSQRLHHSEQVLREEPGNYFARSRASHATRRGLHNELHLQPSVPCYTRTPHI
jgi:hypothetical protein